MEGFPFLPVLYCSVESQRPRSQLSLCLRRWGIFSGCWVYRTPTKWKFFRIWNKWARKLGWSFYFLANFFSGRFPREIISDGLERILINLIFHSSTTLRYNFWACYYNYSADDVGHSQVPRHAEQCPWIYETAWSSEGTFRAGDGLCCLDVGNDSRNWFFEGKDPLSLSSSRKFLYYRIPTSLHSELHSWENVYESPKPLQRPLYYFLQMLLRLYKTRRKYPPVVYMVTLFLKRQVKCLFNLFTEEICFSEFWLKFVSKVSLCPLPSYKKEESGNVLSFSPLFKKDQRKPTFSNLGATACLPCTYTNQFLLDTPDF